MFNYLKHLKKIRINVLFSTNIVIKICNKVLTKFAKYYLRIKELDDMLYNFVNILDFTQKVNLYKLWDKRENDNIINYENKYKIEFKNYFRRYYDLVANLKAKVQRANIIKEIMQYNNAYNFLLMLI